MLLLIHAPNGVAEGGEVEAPEGSSSNLNYPNGLKVLARLALPMSESVFLVLSMLHLPGVFWPLLCALSIARLPPTQLRYHLQ
jgi:hypothetical protein